MDYLHFEKELCEKLVQAGWILSWSSNRNDTDIEWSDLGKRHAATFIEDVSEIFPCHTDERKQLLKEFGQYHGLIAMSELETIRRQVRGHIGDGPYILIICDSHGNAEYSLFQSSNDEAAYQVMLAATKEEKEIVILECSWLREGKLPRSTPFGARGYWVKG